MSDVNMLTSLKALLFSSASTQMPAEGAGTVPPEGAVDFAKLLDGTMDAAPEMPGLPQATAPTVAADAAAVEGTALDGEGLAPARLNGAKAEEGEAETVLPLPFGLANALRAVQSHRKETLPLPPGLARKTEALAEPAAPADALPTPAVDGEPVEEVAAETPAQVGEPVPAVADNGAGEAQEMPVILPGEQPEAARPVKEAKLEQAETLPETPVTTRPDEPVKADADRDHADRTDKDKPEERVQAMPSPDVAAVQTPMPQAAPPQPLPTSARQGEAAAVKPDSGKNLPAEALMQPAAGEQIISAAPTSASADLSLPVTPQGERRPVKSEAIALLQLVRDQVAGRQPGMPVRAGEPVAARVKSGRAGIAAELAPANTAQPVPTDAASVPPLAQPSAGPAVQTAVIAPPTVDLSASLGAQVVDMGVSGQWIDGLAREIAGLSANGAQGRFQINADQLGPVQVDIRHGSDGAAVSLTVASEAAEMALRQDSDRLRLDASLSAVRIAEVKIERAPHVAEAARADGASQQGSQQSSQTPNGWANNGQNMAQSQGQAHGQAQGQGRWRASENGAFSPKNSGDPAVLNPDDARRASHDSLRARYA
ncbi:flagellar hook-length control protein FliK [Sphingobium chungbukense]|uniref:Flagellar hook-length control protein-like C-terminal domain-containing protein n=1 Tax=Sphingobium chungbukense TaxID=56193 RepID=A0A0M3ATF4_9SPHN|nr:flagellar hook-length control protein FliK [Sphingobium chungbukense]KKW93477.1 hypothetical protein YP76_01940 [Sphingobium chungbukense]